MKKWSTLLCSTFCFLNITLPGSLLAAPLDELVDKNEDRTEQATQEDNEYHLAFLTGNFNLESVSMKVGEPINALLMYLTDVEGKIVKDAQVVTTVIDQHGSEQASRAVPYKCGYFVAINQLPVGQYRVEAEMVTRAQLHTKEFMFNKA